MASQKLTALATATPAATDLVYFVDDPGGTPLSRACTVADLASGLSFIGGAISANQVAYGTGANVVGGNAGFTFDPTTTIDDNYETAFTVNRTLTVAPMQSYPGFYGADIEVITSSPDIGQISALVVNAQVNNATPLSVMGGYFEAGQFNISIQNADNATVYGLNVNPSAANADSVTGIYVTPGGSATTITGIEVGSVSGASNNYAIKTGTFGDVVHGTLAGTGTRYVYCDADGKLVAGATV